MKLKPPKKKVINPCFRIEANNGKVYTKIASEENLFTMFLLAASDKEAAKGIQQACTQLMFALCAIDDGFAKTISAMLQELMAEEPGEDGAPPVVNPDTL